jgi:competence protein/uncharacterized protein DUF4131
VAAYLAIAIAANAGVAHVLNPSRTPDSIARMADGSRVTIEGRLYRESEHEAYGDRIFVAVERAAEQGAVLGAARGHVRVAVLGGGTFKVGDEIRLSARIHFPRNYGNPGEFDYAGWMARDGIDATMTAPKNSLGTARFQIVGHRSRFPASQIESIRTHIGGFFDRNLAYPENAEMRALVIGDQGEIGEPLRQTFARTGMAHLLVISGLHLSIVAGAVFAAMRLLMMLFRDLSNRGYANRVAAVAAMLAVCAYASIAGHHVSTVRALVMVLAYMLAVAIDRPREALASMALAAIVILRRTSRLDGRHRLSAFVCVGDCDCTRHEKIRGVAGAAQTSWTIAGGTDCAAVAISRSARGLRGGVILCDGGDGAVDRVPFQPIRDRRNCRERDRGADHGFRRDGRRTRRGRVELLFGAGRARGPAIRGQCTGGGQLAGGALLRLARRMVSDFHTDDSRTRNRVRTADGLAAGPRRGTCKDKATA